MFSLRTLRGNATPAMDLNRCQHASLRLIMMLGHRQICTSPATKLRATQNARHPHEFEGKRGAPAAG